MNLKVPIYRTIAETIKARIHAGQYKPGQKIPPIRHFTQTFGANKATVHKAFKWLKQEGVIENRVGSGSYVRFPEKILQSRGMFDFRTDYLHTRFFPYRQAQQLINNLFETEQGNALAPSPAVGDSELIQILSRQYGLPAERMLIISGAQQGLDLVSKVLGARIPEAILFENPTYPGAISLFRARHFVTLEPDGPDLNHFDSQLSSRIRLFYTMPSTHNPTGISYSTAKKEAVVFRARQHDLYLIEDDYLGELKPAHPRLVDIEPGRTIYIKSFSQTTLSGIRLGLMVVPQDIYDQFVFAKYSSDISSTGLMQKFLSAFIVQGRYKLHMEVIRNHIEKRRQSLERLLDQHPAIEYSPGQSGYSIWVKSTSPFCFSALPWCNGEEFSFSPQFKSYFRLSFMHMDDDVFEKSLFYLDSLLRMKVP
jgi:DNA-binding transcriptional MocR family regulator